MNTKQETKYYLSYEAGDSTFMLLFKSESVNQLGITARGEGYTITVDATGQTEVKKFDELTVDHLKTLTEITAEDYSRYQPRLEEEVRRLQELGDSLRCELARLEVFTTLSK